MVENKMNGHIIFLPLEGESYWELSIHSDTGDCGHNKHGHCINYHHTHTASNINDTTLTASLNSGTVNGSHLTRLTQRKTLPLPWEFTTHEATPHCSLTR